MAVQGLTPDSFFNMQLNAGAFFENVEVDDIDSLEDLKTYILGLLADKTQCLGATSGGGSFQAVPEVREIEADGMRSPVIGSTVFDSWEIKLTTTLKEITTDNLRRSLASGEVTTAGDIKKIKIRNTLKSTDYIKNLAWVGDLADGSLVLIKIDNALNITGANFTFADKGEGTLAVEFKGHQADLANMEYAPCDIYFFE